MAFSNLMRNKKKVVLVVISISLGMTILNGTYSIANSFDMDEYLSESILSDFTVGDVSNFNVNLNYFDQDTLHEGFYKQLYEKKGLKDVNNIYFTEFPISTDPRFRDIPPKLEAEGNTEKGRIEALTQYAKEPKQLLHVYGIDEGIYEYLTPIKGQINMKKFLSGKYVVVASFEESENIFYYDIGDKIMIPDENGTMKSYEVLAIADYPYCITVKHSHPLTPVVYLPSKVFLKQVVKKTPMLCTINVENEYIKSTDHFLKKYCRDIDENMNYQSKASLVYQFENMRNTYKTVGITVSVLVALIGIMNFINAIITSINVRRRELAMLESIGMTGKQVMRMLTLESCLYILFTLIVTITVGSGICYLGLDAFTKSAAYMHLYFTVFPSIVCVPLLLLIAVVIPIICDKIVSKSSIVDRLRETE